MSIRDSSVLARRSPPTARSRAARDRFVSEAMAHDDLVRTLIAEAVRLGASGVDDDEAGVRLAELAWMDADALFDADRGLSRRIQVRRRPR